MKTLKESLLGDIEKNVSKSETDILKEMYPVPKVKDFVKMKLSPGSQYIRWECPKIIQQYINILDDSHFNGINTLQRNDIIGFQITIWSKYEIDVYLYDSRNYRFTLYGIGDCANSMPQAKKDAINFFNDIANKPDNLIKVFNFANKSKHDFDTGRICSNKSYNDILK